MQSELQNYQEFVGLIVLLQPSSQMEAIYENCVKIKSRAGIEYTGLLHSIDTEHSTVTLKREGPVNIRSNSFDYVIFRGGDIEDVQLSFKVRRTITPAHDDAIVRVNSRPFIMNTGYNCWATSGNLRHDPAIVRIDQKANADVSFPAEKNTIDVTSASQQSVHTQCSGDTVNNDDTQRMKENIPNTTDQMRVYDKQHSFFDRLSSGIEGRRLMDQIWSDDLISRRELTTSVRIRVSGAVSLAGVTRAIDMSF
ncbi:protein LSM14 homolog A-B [Clonorchis sinensis]|uniref:Protein LSM14 homolog A-B n=1 Tax=Clonorchis sinensis TaxID=79923 RepID=G7YEY5_CLOSI|nr:protein LSM14 homolog A-B [Clonorchis sinensis]